MKIKDLFKNKEVTLSFEVFPPKTDDGYEAVEKAAARMGWIDEERIVCEMAASAFRAGTSIYITYFAKELAGYIQEGKIG